MRSLLVVLAVLSGLSLRAAAAPRSDTVTVFLERGGQTVTTHDGDEVAIPRFGGTDRAWRAMVSCVEREFAPFRIDITDRRPARGEYITALVGGRASMIGLDDSTSNGIGPYDGTVLRTALVHVFSEVGTGETDVENLCSVTAHEIGHALGLDHEYQCGDIMRYFNDECGAPHFMDVSAACGEESERACASGDDTQNSYRRLAALVGLKANAPEPPREAEIDADDPDEATSDDTDAEDEDMDADDDTYDEAPVASPACSASSGQDPSSSAPSSTTSEDED